MPLCFSCRERPAGNDYGGQFSAYCDECQPRDAMPVLKGAVAQCPLCKQVFASNFQADEHRGSGPSGSVCRDPEAMGLVLDANHVWRTPEAVRANAEKVARMRTVRMREAA